MRKNSFDKLIVISFSIWELLFWANSKEIIAVSVGYRVLTGRRRRLIFQLFFFLKVSFYASALTATTEQYSVESENTNL
jgi:hypothetical protein